MRPLQFLARWFAIKRLEAELLMLRRQTASQLAEMDRTLAQMREMKCVHCGRKVCE